MGRDTFAIPLLNGGIRNDVMTQLISPNEAWDSLNEDSTFVEGATSKRKGRSLITNLGSYPIRCIFEGEIWNRVRIVVCGGQIYKFTPPSTFTEIYSEFDGDYSDVVRVIPYRDELLGRVLVFCDGVNHPMYWDGVNPPQELPGNAPIAKCGIWHKTYFIFGNLKSSDREVKDSGDLSLSTYVFNDYLYSECAEFDLGGPCGGEILQLSMTGEGHACYVYIFDSEPRLLPAFNIEGSTTPTYNQVDLIGTTNQVYLSTAIYSGHRHPFVKFYTKTGKLYVVVKSSGENGARDYTLRLLVRAELDSESYGSDIKWCDNTNINEWTVSTTTLAGRLSIETTGGGDIIAMLPLDLDTFVIYKDDGSITSCYSTGSASLLFGYKTISEGYKLISGNAIVMAEGCHWVLSTEGFLKVTANAVELVEPYGKAKRLFLGLTDDWKNCVATYDYLNRRILVAYPRTGGSTNDGVMVFSIKNGTYDVWDGEYTALGVVSDSRTLTVADFSGVLVGDLTGFTVDDPRLRRASAKVFAGDVDGNVYDFPVYVRSDDATAISSYRESGFIRPDPKYDGQCWFRAIALEIDLLGDCDITLEYRSDYDRDWKSVPVVNTSKGVTDKYTKVIKRYINTTGRAIKVKWSNAVATDTYVIRSMYIEYEKMEEQDD